MAPEDSSPWRLQNSQGNAPLHVALIHAKLEFAAQLIKRDPRLIGFLNYLKESPFILPLDTALIEATVNGQTPLLVAATFEPLEPLDVETMKVILKYCSQSIEFCSSSGKTLLHLLKDGLKRYQDEVGNTLPISAKNRSIAMLEVLQRMLQVEKLF
ncbi:hypothetical protein Cgig2_013042 [Carnegiea gigantea]|uniref:Ankyrin repeat-containing protein n=1 Tax=Carnegiea gigantea TaxID=171969 RepID=A0A9Q1KQJ0_9CARY|nr:hypothetical protein Cgig2_013042 [Carnegiea gigantea]